MKFTIFFHIIKLQGMIDPTGEEWRGSITSKTIQHLWWVDKNTLQYLSNKFRIFVKDKHLAHNSMNFCLTSFKLVFAVVYPFQIRPHDRSRCCHCLFMDAYGHNKTFAVYSHSIQKIWNIHHVDVQLNFKTMNMKTWYHYLNAT